MRNVQRKLDELRDEMARDVDALAEKVRAELVIPFCDKHSLKFVAGMGTWLFFTADGDQFGSGYDWTESRAGKIRMSKTLRDALSADVYYCQNDLGSLIPDYTSRAYDEAKAAKNETSAE